MKVSYVVGAFVLFKAAHAAVGRGSEGHDHGSSDLVGGSSTVTEVIWTDVNTFISVISGVASDSVTSVFATATSIITEIVAGIPGTAKYGDNTSGVVSSAALTETTTSVGSAASSMSSAFTDVVVSTENNQAVGGTSTSTGSPGLLSTVKITSSVVVTTALPTLTYTVDWTSISMDTKPILVTSTETSTFSYSNLPLTILTTADVVKTSSIASTQDASDTAFSSSSSEENEATSILSTSTSTFTVVVTGPTRTKTTTLRISHKPSTSTTISTSAAECVPKTVYITVGAGHPSTKPVEATTSTIVSSSVVKSTMSSAPYAPINSTTLDSGVGATGIPQYKNLSASVTGTGKLNHTFGTNPAKVTLTGSAVNMLNHNKKCLAEIAAGLAVLFGRRFV